jgi:hypothetical protein
MRAIFISYRRNDAEGQAGRLFDDLTQHFGEDAVFMDVATIEAGRDFRRAIDEHVAACGVLLAMIGKNWLNATDEAGARRLDDPMDFVRLETASALKRDIPVVPVLVQGARMPRVDELPENLKELAFRNGVELTHARWDSDLQLLVKALQSFVQPKPEAPQLSPAPPTAARRTMSRLGVVGIAVLVLALGGYVWYQNAASAPAPAPPEHTQPPSTGAARNILSFRDWEGSWDLKWQFNGDWYEKVMTVTATQTGIAGDYVLGTLQGQFVQGDVSRVSGEITNTTNTGTTCKTGQQAGLFQLTLANDGRHVEGWWDVCGEGTKWAWKADKR